MNKNQTISGINSNGNRIRRKDTELREAHLRHPGGVGRGVAGGDGGVVGGDGGGCGGALGGGCCGGGVAEVENLDGDAGGGVDARVGEGDATVLPELRILHLTDRLEVVAAEDLGREDAWGGTERVRVQSSV